MKNILQKPLITEKLSKMQAEGKYAFAVDLEATKPEIKQAVLDRYPNVKVKKVNTMIMPSKPKGQFTRSGYVEGRSKAWKKAIITLKEGDINFSAKYRRLGKCQQRNLSQIHLEAGIVLHHSMIRFRKISQLGKNI